MHGACLASATAFHAGLRARRDAGALIYGECGGYMVLGEALTDHAGVTHPMTGLLPIRTDISRPLRRLGYRHLRHNSPCRGRIASMATSSIIRPAEMPFICSKNSDSLGAKLPPLGAVLGRVMGSYAHVIDVA